MAYGDVTTLNRIRQEYEEGRSYLETKKQRWVAQLQMLNNLQRGSQTIASTMLLSFFLRVFSNLYSNVMTVKFVGTDAEMRKTEGLNFLARNDAQEMDKATIDYDNIWDACAFGAGYRETLDYDKDRMLMKPVTINPLFLSYDPFFSNPQQWRYYSKWILRPQHEIERLIDDGIIDGVSSIKDIETGVDPYIWQWQIQVEQARLANPVGTETLVDSSGIYQILEHFTYIKGVKHVVWTNRSITKILRKFELELNDDIDHPTNKDKGEFESLWPINKTVVFREPHSSTTMSILDLIEDKHRAKNVLMNLAYIASKDEVNPLYEYVPEMMQNPGVLNQRQILQHIPVNELGKAMAPIKTKAALSQSVLQFMNILNQESADAIGTGQPPIQGAKKGQQKGQDAQLAQMMADLVTSLQTKLVMNSEREFWGTWYQRLVNNMDEGDIKQATITDILGTTFHNIALEEVKTKYPPRVIVTSSKEAEYKETLERREIAQQLGLIQGATSPEQFKLFLKEFWFPKFKTFDFSSIDLVFPKSLDEMKAEEENDLLSQGKWAEVSMEEDHMTHLYIHARAKKTAETNTHILTHRYALAMQKRQQDQAQAQAAQKAQQDGQGGEGGDGGAGQGQGGPQGQGGAAGAKKEPPKPGETAIPKAGSKVINH